MITPSAISPDLGRLRGGADPEADRDRDLGVRLGRGDQLGQRGGQLGPLAGRPDGRDDVDEAARATAQIRPRRSAGVVGATSGTSASPAAANAVARSSSASPSGRSGTIAPAAPAAAARRGELLGAAVREDHVRVDHQHHRNPLGDRAADLERGRERRPAPPAPPSPRRESSARRRADPRTGPRARSGRRRRPRRRRRPPARSRGRDTRPSCRASAPPGLRSRAAANAGDRSSPSARGRRVIREPPRCCSSSHPPVPFRLQRPRPGPCRRARRGRGRRSPRRRRVLQQPGDRVRGLERRDDPLQPRQLAEGAPAPPRR